MSARRARSSRSPNAVGERSGVAALLTCSVLTWLLAACTEPSFQPDASALTAPDADGDADEPDLEPGPTEPDAEVQRNDVIPEGDASPTQGGCVQACALDASTNVAPIDPGPASDAGSSGLDPMRANWVGRYAARSFLFFYDSPVRTSATFLTVADIRPSADGGLEMEEELCRWQGDWALFATATLRVDFPKGTRLRSAVHYDAEHFESALASVPIGYGATPASCTPSTATAPRTEAQTWLSTSNCDCPGDPGTLPPACVIAA